MSVYVRQNPKSKKALREMLPLDKSDLFKPSWDFGMGGPVPDSGRVSLEGPHYPKPHSWWGTGTMVDGKLVKVQ